MKTKRPNLDATDWTLLAVIACLTVFLLFEISPPLLSVWRNYPRPGVQVCQQYIVKQDPSQDVLEEINYLLYLPKSYSKNTQWPLVVFLHGAGQRGYDLNLIRQEGLPKEFEQEPTTELRQMIRNRFILISPQCPENSGWGPGSVIDLVEHICRKYAVDRTRIYLTGFSMGGRGTWSTACHAPELFAAIVPLAGSGDPSQAECLKDMPIWAFHGDKDNTVKVSNQEEMVEAVKKYNENVKFTVYPSKGHDICDITYQDPKLYEWLLAQRRDSSAAAHSSKTNND
jgi:predicted peptidase